MSRRFALRARWLLPVAGPPLEGGLVSIEKGRIAAIGENRSAAPPLDLGDVLLLPGLVNAHAHLDLSSIPTPIGDRDLPMAAWLAEVIRYRRSLPEAAAERRTIYGEAVRRGLRESLIAGVTTLGDIVTADAAPTANLPDRPSRVAYLELIALDPNRIEERLLLAAEHVRRLQFGRSGGAERPGISPHAPYTVSVTLLEAAVELARLTRVPVAMHLAESQEEIELLATHRGPLRDLLEQLGVWTPSFPSETRPLDYLQRLSRAPAACVIHGNYLSREEQAFVAERRDRLSVVYCPRTHAHFRHPPYPLAAMLRAGVRVVLGTDSRASSPDLNLLAEARAVAAGHPEVAPAAILPMITSDAARAIGAGDRAGELTVGRPADLTTVAMSRPGADPLEDLVGGDGSVVGVWLAGRRMV